jgi:ferredoxin
MAVRKIVSIDESKCNGCGLCIPNCAEGALKIIDGKAKLVKDIYCDGLGACLGHCPMEAINIIEREAADFNVQEVEEFLKEKKVEEKSKLNNQMDMHMGGCPSSRMRMINRKAKEGETLNVKATSTLRQWPVQLSLVSANAPYFKGADLLITADCVPFAYANYHNDFLKDRAVVIGCPKLDDVSYYTEKLSDIIKNNELESITVLRMEVPCCGGMAMAAKDARNMAGSDVPVKVVTIGIEGEVLKREYL